MSTIDMRVTAIVLAAGRGLRFSHPVSKPLAEINNKPLIIHSLRTLSHHPLVRDIIVVVNSKNSKAIINKIKQYHITKVIKIVKGGLRRQDSVYQGLNAMNRGTDLVLIHDAVRPFIDRKLVSSLISKAGRNGAAITGVPVKATIKRVANRKSQITNRILVKDTLDRHNLWEIQTPQVFKRDLILQAYKKFSHIDATDDAMLVEKLGAKVSVVLGSYSNIKITTPEDLAIAEAIAKIKKNS